MDRARVAGALAVGVVAGAIVGYLIGAKVGSVEEAKPKDASARQDQITEMRHGKGYRYINPLLECDNFKHSGNVSLAALEGKLEAYVKNVKRQGLATKVAVYYRDLNNGPWIGIRESDAFSPASLLKVPIMIAILKMAETDPKLLSRKVHYDAIIEWDMTVNVKDEIIKVGNSYTVEDLLHRMIAYSDNEAKNLLMMQMSDSFLDKVLSDFGIRGLSEDVPDEFLSVKEYSSFFRILYNATYLKRDMSEKALEILGMSRFGYGIRGGIPEGVIVCHKFGERGVDGTEHRQLHDCGIVYKGSNPYLLCVMTHGDNWDNLSQVIQEVSALVYQGVR